MEWAATVALYIVLLPARWAPLHEKIFMKEQVSFSRSTNREMCAVLEAPSAGREVTLPAGEPGT
jgi:hypothetical protein